MPARAPNLPRYIYFPILAAIVAVSVFVQTRGLDRNWGNYRDANGFSQGEIADNYRRFGLFTDKLAPVYSRSPRPDLDGIFDIKFGGNPYFITKENRVILAHYPPTMSLAMYTAFKIFGKHPATTRLLFICVTIAGVLLFAHAARWAAGDSESLVASFFLALSPMLLCYGQMADTIVLIQPFITGAVYHYSLWCESRKAKNIAFACLFIIGGCSIGWYCYLAVPVIVAHHVFFRRGKFSPAIFFILPSAAAACLSAFIAWLLWSIGPEAVVDWLKAYSTRTGGSIVINDIRHPITMFQYVKTIVLRIPFHFSWPVFIGFVAWLYSVRKNSPLRGDAKAATFASILFIAGAMPIIFLRQGVFVHGFFLYLIGPGVCLVAAIVYSSLLRRRTPIAVAACLLAVIWFTAALPQRYESLTSYLKVDTLDEFARFITSVSDKDAIVGQDVYDFAMVEWMNNYTKEFVMQRELPLAKIKQTVKLLPKDKHFIYIHTPMPDTYREHHTEDVLAWLYRNYGFYEKHGNIVFDTRMKPRESGASTTPAYPVGIDFQENIKLIGIDLKDGDKSGQVKIVFHWKCLKPMPDNFFILVKMEPGVLHADHEPVNGVYLTSHWREGETVIDTVTINDAPAGDYPIQVALCAKKEPDPFCLKPAAAWVDDSPPGFVELPGVAVKIKGASRAARTAPAVAARIADIPSYMEYYDLRSYTRFMKLLGMDKVLIESFKGWEYLFFGQSRKALPILENLADRLDEFNMIEKMVPTAMQEVPVLLKFRLITIYMEEVRPIPLVRQSLSLAFNLPVSYPIYLRIGKQLDKKANGAGPAALVIGTLSDYFHKKAWSLWPSNPDTKRQMVEHYILTGRPHDAFRAVRNSLGVERKEDIRLNAMFAAYALATREFSDYDNAKHRMKLMGNPEMFDDEVFNMLLAIKDDDALFTFFDRQDDATRRTYIFRAVERAMYQRDFPLAESIADKYGASGMTAATVQERSAISSYFSMLAYSIFTAGYPDKAVSYYEIAQANSPADTAILFNLANLYNRTGNKDKARNTIRDLLAINPKDESAVKLLKQIEGDKQK